MPDEPLNVKFEVIDVNTLRMTWNPPRPTGAEVKGYVVYWNKVDGFREEITLDNINEYTFSSLEPGQMISASVCAFSDEDLFKESHITGLCSYHQWASLPMKEGG